MTTPDSRRILFAVAAGLLALGCSRSSTTATGFIPYKLGERDGALTLTVGSLTLVFESVPPPEGHAGSAGTFTPPTPGSSGRADSGFGGLTVKQAWADGVNTITVGGTSFKLTDGGAKLTFGDQSFALDGPAQTITVAKDGTAKVQP